ncbi:hypothetical protein EXM22_01825 [Oceanispirochaeta crateris]|uniref:Uncharacterized protein n=1 Tax=Oceanispirochaeta crateris TaxID=2518645 RepID=A0A5C1QPC5_9SPIO|nr:hypothetical protein EXM22_01825 [Oceanispirochaeta crateris]
MRSVSTKDAGFIQDYYTIDIDGLAKNDLENAISEVETPASHIIR